MKSLFPEFFNKSEKAHKELWEKCLFVFDANILLNLYRYSDEARNDFLRVLEDLKGRVWIPRRVAEEYFNNRLKVISEQQDEYTQALSDVVELSKKLESTRQHPFVSAKVMKGVSESISLLKSELEANKDLHGNRMLEDEIKFKLAEIFEDRIGRELSADELEALIAEGEGRYAEKIPPGYSDMKKASGEIFLNARCRPYGDLIIWKQIIERSKELSVPVVFVTDDGKEDWWLRFKGKTIGPRPELIREFMRETSLDFHMYHPERFLSLAGDFLKQKASDGVIDEIRNMRIKDDILSQAIDGISDGDIDSMAKYSRSDNAYFSKLIHERHGRFESDYLYFSEKLKSLEQGFSKYEQKARILKARIMALDALKSVDGPRDEEPLNAAKAEYDSVERKKAMLLEEFKFVSSYLDSIRKKITASESRLADLGHLSAADNVVKLDDLI